MSDLHAPVARRRPMSMYAGTGLALAPGSHSSPSAQASAANNAHAQALANLTGNGAARSTPPSHVSTPGLSATPPESSPTPSKLKRLSLVPRTSTPRRRAESGSSTAGSRDYATPPPAMSSRRPSSPSSSSTPSPPSAPGSPTPTSTATCSPAVLATTPGAAPTIRAPPAAASPTPRRSRPSSISYSPSTVPNIYALGSPNMRRFDRTERRMSEEVGVRNGGNGVAPSPPAAPEALTLAEKHADLLRTIAMRERRVNELRQELNSQETALAALRSRWTSIARADAVAQGQQHAPQPPVQSPPSAVQAAHSAAQSAASLGEKAAAYALSSTTAGASALGALGGRSLGAVRAARTSGSGSSSSSLPTVPDDEPLPAQAGPDGDGALSNIWSAITADADETIQEGKRFWGQLLKTVGAAAGGAVPEETEEERRTPDVSGFRTMLPAVSLSALGGRRNSTSHPLSSNAITSPPPADTSLPATAPAPASPSKRNSIRLQRPSLTPGPNPNSNPMARMGSGTSTTSHTSASRSLLDDSDDDTPAGGAGPLLEPVRKSPSPSPQNSPLGPLDTSAASGAAVHSPASPVRPVTVMLDGMLW